LGDAGAVGAGAVGAGTVGAGAVGAGALGAGAGAAALPPFSVVPPEVVSFEWLLCDLVDCEVWLPSLAGATVAEGAARVRVGAEGADRGALLIVFCSFVFASSSCLDACNACRNLRVSRSRSASFAEREAFSFVIVCSCDCYTHHGIMISA